MSRGPDGRPGQGRLVGLEPVPGQALPEVEFFIGQSGREQKTQGFRTKLLPVALVFSASNSRASGHPVSPRHSLFSAAGFSAFRVCSDRCTKTAPETQGPLIGRRAEIRRYFDNFRSLSIQVNQAAAAAKRADDRVAAISQFRPLPRGIFSERASTGQKATHWPSKSHPDCPGDGRRPWRSAD